MKVNERFELAKATKLCFKCLKKHKDVLRCDRKKPCKKCEKGHSTWLHERPSQEVSNAVGILEDETITNAFGAVLENQKQVLLATTLISTKDFYGGKVTLRALIDSGSQGSMITERAAAILQLQQDPTSKHISGLGENSTKRIKVMKLTIKPRFYSDINLEVDCYILKRLTKTLPDADINTENWHHLKNLRLADPTFNLKGQIDVLLGTDVVSEILKSGFIKGPKGTPMAQETTFGWIISGNIDPKYPTKTIKCLVSTKHDDQDLSKFWEMEELHPKRNLTPDELACEEIYKETHSRDKDGIFTVKIPFKNRQFGPSSLGQSRGQAMARYLQLEKRFKNDSALKQEYTQVMKEYKSMGHMVPVDGLSIERLYYIPNFKNSRI